LDVKIGDVILIKGIRLVVCGFENKKVIAKDAYGYKHRIKIDQLDPTTKEL